MGRLEKETRARGPLRRLAVITSLRTPSAAEVHGFDILGNLTSITHYTYNDGWQVAKVTGCASR